METIGFSVYLNRTTGLICCIWDSECVVPIPPLLLHHHYMYYRGFAHKMVNDDTSSLLSARNILLHDFRQVLGCTVLRANVDCKLQRLPFIRATAVEAKKIVHNTKKINTSGISFDFNRWFQNVGDDGVYDSFYRFLNHGQRALRNTLAPDRLDSLTHG